MKRYMSKIPMSPSLEITLMTLGIMPGSDREPCTVWVLPEDVTPYANTVTTWQSKFVSGGVSLAIMLTTHNTIVDNVNEWFDVFVVDLILGGIEPITRRETSKTQKLSERM